MTASHQPPPSTGPFDPPELRSLLAVLAADLEGLSWRGSPAGPLHVAGYASGQMGADRAADAAATLGWRIAVPPERDYVEGGVRLSLTLMPPHQPPPGTDVVALDPFWWRSLFAVLDRPSYRITHGGALELEGYVWAPESEAFSPATRYDASMEAAVRRALYDAVEEAIASVEKLGWTHAKEPAIHITVAERDVFESVSPPRIGAHVFLTLRPGDAPPPLREMPE